MKKLLMLLGLSVLLVACGGSEEPVADAEVEANDSSSKEGEASGEGKENEPGVDEADNEVEEYRSMPLTLEQFSESYNTVVGDSDIATLIDTKDMQQGEIIVDETITIKLNDDDTFAGVSYVGDPDVVVPSLILTSLGISSDEKVSDLIDELNTSAFDTKEVFTKEVSVEGMNITGVYLNGIYSIFVDGEGK